MIYRQMKNMAITGKYYSAAILVFVIIFYNGHGMDSLNTISARGRDATQGTVRFKKEVIEHGNFSLVGKRLNRERMKKYRADELRIIRNTIFAKYGYRFRSPDLRKHFKKFKWYKADPKITSQIKRGKILTGTDKYNIYMLKGLENEIEKRAGKTGSGGSDPRKWWNGRWDCGKRKITLKPGSGSSYMAGTQPHYYHKKSKTFVFCVQASGGAPYCINIRFKDRNTFIVATGEEDRLKDRERCRRE